MFHFPNAKLPKKTNDYFHGNLVPLRDWKLFSLLLGFSRSGMLCTSIKQNREEKEKLLINRVRMSNKKTLIIKEIPIRRKRTQSYTKNN